MIRAYSVQELATACHAQLLQAGDHVQLIDRVSTDSRDVGEGDLFVALRGERFDAHDFLGEVASRQVEAAVVDHEVAVPVTQLLVADTEKALGQIAAYNRKQFSGSLAAITGSNGKTTVKNMLAGILSERDAVLATEGNFNNFVGVPLTLLRIDSHHRFAVIEMGANAAGEIDYLASLAVPDVAVVTNVSLAHIGGFGDIETTAKTKSAIYRHLGENGVAVFNLDEPFSAEWRQQFSSMRSMTFSLQDAAADVFADEILLDVNGCPSFRLHYQGQQMTVRLALLGEHNVANALAASCMALALGMSLEEIGRGLEKTAAYKGRMQFVELADGCRLIDDTYNASPASVLKAIDLLATYNGLRCLVLGDMAELGEASSRLHAEVGEYARKKGIDRLLACGTASAGAVASFGQGGEHFADKQALVLALQKQKNPAAVFLVKGSRSAAMEVVVEALKNARGIR